MKSTNNPPKIAIYYDWLNQWGGAEKVLLDILTIYPDAPVFTLVHQPLKTSWLPSSTKVITSKINNLPYSKNNPIFYTPFYDIALEQFDFSPYDIVISTTSTIGHCLITPPTTLSICYFHNINRYLYQTPPKYKILKPLLNLYSQIDKIYCQRPNVLLCNSQTVKKRIEQYYQRSVSVINPGIDINFFTPIPKPTNDYYLVISRLVPHKNIDVVINTFKSIPDKLIIIGAGRQQKYLKSLAINNKNIIFLGAVDQGTLLHYYQNCQALICPQYEDFGLTPIEAQACGKPVIAYGKGGLTETVINGKTGLYFTPSTSKTLTNALKQFKKLKFLSTVCRQNAVNYSRQQFMLNFKLTVDTLWQKHQTTLF